MGKHRSAVALIERYARAESMERKDVVNIGTLVFLAYEGRYL